MRLPYIVAVTALAACAPSKQRRCERFANDGLGMLMGIATGVATGLGANDTSPIDLNPDDKQRAIAKLIEECMTWPDDYVGCMTDGDFESATCREAYARKEGLVVRVDGSPGPAATEREVAKYDVLECRSGACVIEGEGDVAHDLDGKALAPGRFVGVITSAGKPTRVLAQDGEIKLVSASSESTTFAAPRTTPDDPFLVPLATTPSGLVLFDDDSVRRFVPPSSFEPTPWRTRGASTSSELHETAGGLLHYNGDSRIEVLAADGTPTFSLSKGYGLGPPLVVGDRVHLGIDKEALSLDLTRCKSVEPVSTADLTAPCVASRIVVAEDIYERPVQLGSAIYFLVGSRIVQVVDGRQGWVAEVEAGSLVGLERDGHRYLFVASYWTMDHPSRLLALDPDSGMTLMQSDIPSDRSFSSGALERVGEQLAMIGGNRLYRWDVGALFKALAER